MWCRDWRDDIWEHIDQAWDLIVIGGGITGAGILREATRAGLRTLLVEKHDFAWGTSCRSSKLVHGGLRYLKEGRVLLTHAAVRERESLLQAGPGLIDPLGFLLAVYEGDFPGRWTYELGLSVYDLMALQWGHEYFGPEDFQLLAPHIAQENLLGGFRYRDAQTDDARLVLRIIWEAVAEGGVACNYLAAVELLKDEAGHVNGVRLVDNVRNRHVNIHARVVVNATGVWADDLRSRVSERRYIRPLRGSHIIFPAWRVPVAQAVSFLHPLDRRPVFIFPWEGVTLVGTTDVDHEQHLDCEPSISPQEVAYLMVAVESRFPGLGISLEDVISSFAGVRPVIGSGKSDPSKESRDHVIWDENGLLTVTGGKMTTFRLIALDVLKVACHRLPDPPALDSGMPALNPVEKSLPGAEDLPEATCRRLLGRFGAEATAVVRAAQPGELEAVGCTPILWAELRWAARAEGVVHLDDLLLRRVRLGLLLPQGAAQLMPAIRAICQPELGWDDVKWEEEQAAYLALWHSCYSLPPKEAISDWKLLLANARSCRLSESPGQPSRAKPVQWLIGVLAVLALTGVFLAWLRLRRKRSGGMVSNIRRHA